MIKVENNKIELVSRLIDFVVMVSLFFPVLVELFMGLTGSDKLEVGKVTISSSLVIIFAIVNWLVFNWRKLSLAPWAISWLSRIYFLTIICFIFVILLMSWIGAGLLSKMTWELRYGFPLTLFCYVYLPVLSVVLMLVDPVRSFLRNLLSAK